MITPHANGFWYVNRAESGIQIIVEVHLGNVYETGASKKKNPADYQFLAPVPKLQAFQPEQDRNIIMDNRKVS